MQDQPSEDPSGEEKIVTETQDQEEEALYSAFPKPYLIRKVLKETEVAVKSTGDLRVVLSELECEWVWAKPMGTQIKTAPFLDYYLERKKNISLWNKPVKVTTPGLGNKDVNEPAVGIKEPVFNNFRGARGKKKEEKTEERDEHGLVPIGEEEDDDDQRNPRSNNQDADEDDDQINAVSVLLTLRP